MIHVLLNAVLLPTIGGTIMGRTLGDAYLYALSVRLDRRQLSRRERTYIRAVILCCAAYLSHFVVLPIWHSFL